MVLFNDVTGKRCSLCRKVKPTSSFHKDRSRPDGLNHRCRLCNSKRQRKGDARRRGIPGHRDKRRVYELNYYYGLSLDEYEALLAKQHGICAICGKKPERVLAVDHDHENEYVRGLFCRPCNSAIGLFGDNPETLRAAADYLQYGPVQRKDW